MDDTQGRARPHTPPTARYPAHHRLPARRPDPAVGADLHAALDARRELGPEYEGALVEGFLERLEQSIDARIDYRLAQQPSRPARQGIDGGQLALGIVTTALGIPLTGIAVVAGQTGVVGLVIVWVGILLVNLAATVTRRR